MRRFYLKFGAAIAITVAAGTMAAFAQPILGAPPPVGFAPPPTAFSPPGQVPARLPPPPPFPPPPMFGHTFAGGVPLGEICLDKIARELALRAYLKERLKLSPQQLTVWQEFENAAAEADNEERQGCSRLAASPDAQTIAKRMDMAEEMLTRRLAHMQKVGVPLRKVIGTLSPDQMQLFEQAMPPMPPMAL